MCVCLKNGLRLWLSTDRASQIALAMYNEKKDSNAFVSVDDRMMVALSEIVGIFPPETILDDQERRRGGWLCPKTGIWHGKDRDCDCMEKIIRPELNRTVVGPAGVMLSPEEFEAVKKFDDPEAAAVGLRKGHTDFGDWLELKKLKRLPAPET